MSILGRDLSGVQLQVQVEDGRITAVERGQGSTDGLPLLLPGLVDAQVNGFAGHDLNAPGVSAGVVEELAGTLLHQGVTGFVPTLVTGPPERMLAGIRAVAEACRAGGVARQLVVGVHLEGPFIAAGEGVRGAHDPAWMLDPDPALLDDWLAAAKGLPLLVTLAPERPGAAEFIAAAVQRGVRVAIGHCQPTPEQCRRAVDAGATLATHLGNGLPAMIPRHPNHVWTLLADDRVHAGLVADGDHLPADTFTAIVRAKTPQRCFLVSDSAALAHCPPGDYHSPIGGAVTVEPGGGLRMTGTPYLAGSGSSLRECLLWAVRHTPIPAADLVTMATGNPARRLGATGRGVLEVGGRADLLVIDPGGATRVVLAGRERAVLEQADWTGLAV